MEVKFEELVQAALAAKADHAAIAEVAKINFVEDFRKACEQNVCRKYNTNWVCPPAVGSFAELKAKACQYKNGLLFQTVHQMKSAFDWKGMMAAKKIHDGVFRGILDSVKTKFKLQNILPLNAGNCEFCERCAYLDSEPCRFPDEAFASVEAYGIDVIKLEKACGIPYYNGKNTVSYVGLILFNAEKAD
jgi:predicted metal-binding protein